MTPRPGDPAAHRFGPARDSASRGLASEAPYLAAVFALCLAVYVATMPGTVTFEDSGELIAVSLSGGVAHPPGYPLYVLLGQAFGRLPIASPAVRIHLLSATAGAAACVALYLCVWFTTRARAPALMAAGLLAFSATFWSQAIIAEVYTLHALLYLAVLALCLRAHREFRWRTVRAAALGFGLGLSNHWPLMLLGSGAFALLLAPHLRRLLARPWGLFALVGVGLTPYTQLLWASRRSGAVTAWGPVASLGELGDYVWRVRYATLERAADATGADVLGFVGQFARALSHEFTPWLALAVPVGAWLLRRRLSWFEGGALAWALLAPSVLLHLFVRWPFDAVHAEVFLAYQIVPIAIAAWLAGSSLLALEAEPHSRRGLVAVAIAAAATLACLVANATTCNLRDETLAHDYALAVLESLPPDSHLVVNADMDTGPIAYAQLVEGVRPDVRVHSRTGYLFAPRLVDSSRPGWQAQARNALARIAIESGSLFDTDIGHSDLAREVFTPDGETVIRSSFEVRDHGLFQQIGDAPLPVDDQQVLDRANAMLDTEAAGEYSDHWRYLKHLALGRACRVLLVHGRTDHPVLRRVPECVHALALERAAAGELDEASSLLAGLLASDPLAPASQRRRRNNDYLLVELRRLGLDRELEAYQSLADRVAEETLRRPACDDPALPNLLSLAALKRVELPADRLRDAFGHCPGRRLAPLRAEREAP